MPIKDRIFGSDIDARIKQKLAVRQALNRTSDFGEAINAVDERYISEAIDMDQYDFYDGTKVYADLSSRTPFARMWTAVQVVKIIKTGTGYSSLDELKKDKTQLAANQTTMQDGDQWYIANIEESDKIIYEIGNHELTRFSNQPNQRVQGNEETDSIETIIPNVFESNSNEYMKPPAGITSISSTTEGIIGAIKRTTVNFTVHNIHDFDKIYSKYFLKPGAQIFIDMGWSSADIYPIDCIVNDESCPDDLTGESVDDKLYGEDGFLVRAKGDLESLVGFVLSLIHI